MAVALDAKMSGGNGTSGECQKVAAATSISSTGMTVGSGATLLIGILCWQNSTSGARTMTWNSTSMTEVAHIAGANQETSIFVLVSPASGNNTLAAAWTTAVDCYMSCISFTGTDTTTGIEAADTVTATSGTTVTVTSTTDGVTIASWTGNGAAPTVNFNQIFSQGDLNPGSGASYQLGGTSNGHTFTGGGATLANAGVHVLSGGIVDLMSRNFYLKQGFQ